MFVGMCRVYGLGVPGFGEGGFYQSRRREREQNRPEMS